MTTPEEQDANLPDYPWRATIVHPDFDEAQDITREIAVLYDAIVGSMDWGSGFLDIEDVRALMRIKKLCGFEGADSYELSERGYPNAYVILGDEIGNAMTKYPQGEEGQHWSVAYAGIPHAKKSITPDGEGYYTHGKALGVHEGVATHVIYVKATASEEKILAVEPLPAPITIVPGQLHDLPLLPLPRTQTI